MRLLTDLWLLPAALLCYSYRLDQTSDTSLLYYDMAICRISSCHKQEVEEEELILISLRCVYERVRCAVGLSTVIIYYLY